jgi:VWFA-related protein
MDHIGHDNNVDDQITARHQLELFLRAKPPGVRVELYLLAHKLQLLQGFTTDREQLLQVLDVKRKDGHIPWVLLTRMNYAGNDVTLPFTAMMLIARQLEGLPGRKNLIWLSSQFPVPFTSPNNSFGGNGSPGPNKYGGPDSVPETASPAAIANMPNQEITGSSSLAGQDITGQQTAMREALDALNNAQVSVYPVDVQGLTQDAEWGGIDYIAQRTADETGGQAYYNRNDVGQAIEDATENGGSYYEMTYAPQGHVYDGKLHHIKVELEKPGYTLEYRRSYFDDDPQKPLTTGEQRIAESVADQVVAHHPGDTLYAYMVQGAPIAHDVLFRAQIHPGPTAMATHEQMADLQMQPAYFVVRKRNHPAKTPPAVPLRKYMIDYLVLDNQIKARAGQVLEFAVCAYDAEGRMLNGLSQMAVRTPDQGKQKKVEAPLFRGEQTLEVPTNAQWLRVAVRDPATDRIGTIEVKLPLAGDTGTAPDPQRQGD